MNNNHAGECLQSQAERGRVLLLFVVQPLEVSPNDESAWATLNPLVLFMTGALSGVLASNGLKDKEQKDDQQ